MHLRFRRLEEVILLDMIRYPPKRFLLQIGAFLADLALSCFHTLPLGALLNMKF